MHNRHLLALALAAALALLVAAPALAGHDDAVTEPHDTDTLTAIVLESNGRTIEVVTPPVASVLTGTDILSVGTPGSVVVAEVGAAGSNGWNVKLTLDDVLKQTTDATNTMAKTTVKAQSTTERVCVLPLATCGGLTLTDTNNADNNLGSQLTLFTVGGQSTSTFYTATYTSAVAFTVDASAYEGPLATMEAPFTVTLYQ